MNSLAGLPAWSCRQSNAYQPFCWLRSAAVSVGVAFYPEHGTDAETLLKNADLALYDAKTNGRNSVHRFIPGLAEAAAERIALSRRMRLALKNGDFVLHYQPQIELENNRVTIVSLSPPTANVAVPAVVTANAPSAANRSKLATHPVWPGTNVSVVASGE